MHNREGLIQRENYYKITTVGQEKYLEANIGSLISVLWKQREYRYVSQYMREQ